MLFILSRPDHELDVKIIDAHRSCVYKGLYLYWLIGQRKTDDLIGLPVLYLIM